MKLELSRDFSAFLCQENLTKLFGILCAFGTAFANTPRKRGSAGRVGRKSLCSNNLRTPTLMRDQLHPVPPLIARSVSQAYSRSI